MQSLRAVGRVAQRVGSVQSQLRAVGSEPSQAALNTWEHYSNLSRTEGHTQYPNVNQRYKPQRLSELPTTAAQDNARGQMSDKHLKEEWSEAEIKEAVQDNVMMTWANSGNRTQLPIIVRGEGVYLIDNRGEKYMDLTSQAVCTNMGYTVPETTLKAVMKQLTDLPYAYPGMAMTEVRARLCSLLGEITPGDINGFLFPLGGSEANEGAIRIARRYTGKHKIMSAMRSYHGGTSSPLAATGDFRTHFVDGQSGFVKIFNPHSLTFSTGVDDASAAEMSLRMLEEQIIAEGPQTIAAILLETIVGANGVFIHPASYLEGVRGLCDKYNILLILDEVMCGFWRTGPLFAFQHFKSVVPDILTSAKGLTSSFLPLGMIAVRQHIKDHFETAPLGWGATYANHPVLLACAYEAVRNGCLNNLESKVANIEKIMLEGVDKLVRERKCVSQGRAIGAFGCLDLVNKEGKALNMLGEPLTWEGELVKKAIKDEKMIGLFRSPLFHICPPLVINEEELRDLFNRVNNVLTKLDEAIAASD